MSRFIIASLFVCLSTHFSIGQLSGISVAYGKSFQQPIHAGGEYIKSNPLSVEISKYIHRFWNVNCQFQYKQGGFFDQAHFENSFSSTRLGGSLNYYVLNDIRLLGKMARSSCKGKLVAKTYKFRIFLSGGLYANWLKSKANDLSSFYGSYALGLGINMYQFAISKNPTRTNSITKYALIPFFTANYIGGFTPLTLSDIHQLKIQQLEFKLGLKFALF